MGSGNSNHIGCFMDQENYEAGIIAFDLVYTIGGTGAITAVKTKGITASRVSAGLYRFKFNNAVNKLMTWDAHIDGAAPTTTDGFDPYLTTDSSNSTTNPLFEITFYPKGTSVTATDPASGVTMRVLVRAKVGPV